MTRYTGKPVTFTALPVGGYHFFGRTITFNASKPASVRFMGRPMAFVGVSLYIAQVQGRQLTPVTPGIVQAGTIEWLSPEL